ncbi:MAG: glycerol-3-phosphate 1-O-acyltransferase [Acidimicrobiia bacterium]|nr:glycerol-3-phosphate 1-O-acyltransferase [Acidimicrobiia bacterium]MBT8193791.1 glycerol-3-phosphate 1-O-acyltransferase [Acidimicrobiia bacterium]NNF88954.1 glycerol-3-phosphate 1-O-acyltransferase [Acidimicrobiia bacterium]NNL13562.1 glycerol-3-phosphate 1-O-acyltransferase [Acidimicrobiia bacterium]NNL98769.1 glycerol-3-phosphate 1-O-acyltransferase [Acidimicrobiia bacterium]
MTSTQMVNEPAWPDSQGRAVAFLIDTSNRLEQDLIRDWIERTQPFHSYVETAEIPPSRRHRRHRRLSPVLRATLGRTDDPLLVPLRVVWLAGDRGGVRRVRLSDLIMTGDPRDPDPIRARWIRARHPDRVRLVAGISAPLSTLRAEWAEQARLEDFTEFVAHRAWLALERAERNLRGNRYKVPKFVQEDIVSRHEFQQKVIDIGRSENKSGEWALRKSNRYVKEIAATHSPIVIDLVANAVHWLHSKTYTGLDYDREGLQQIYALGQQAPLVFLPSHKSNFDHLILNYLLWENDFPPNHTAGGINMNFFPIGPLLRRAGVFFIRRSFKDNDLYKAVLRAYVDFLLERRFPLEWYIEGGRSRLGKLRSPRYGMLSYVADSYRRGKSDEVYLIPISIAYDQIVDVGSYAAEQRGEAKDTEGAGWLVRTIGRLKLRGGQVHLRFGEPISMSKEVTISNEPDEQSLEIRKLAFEVSRRINEVTPITPTALVTIAMLANEGRALTLQEITDYTTELNEYIAQRNIPTTLADPLDTGHELDAMLGLLVDQNIISGFEGGLDTVWRIQPDQHHAAAYYRNTVVHFFITGAIAELALVKASESEGDHRQAFWDEVMAMRDLLKFEFFFSEKDVYREQIHQELAHREPGWEDRLDEHSESIRELLRVLRILRAHWAVRPFMEAYQVVADVLATAEAPMEKKEIIDQSMALGKQYRLQNRIAAEESVSKILFESALQLADNRGLLDEDRTSEEIRAFGDEIRDVLRRIAVVESLATRRWAGH